MILVAYGSLLDAKRVKDKNCKLVIVKGWKRIFNRVASREIWKRHSQGNEIGVLNAIKDKGSFFNAIIFDVDNNDLKRLKEREQDYYLDKTTVYDYKTSKNFGQHHIFVSNKKNSKNETIIKNDIIPVKRYLNVCRKAAYSLGNKFGKEFDETTYLSDGTTTLKEFLEW